MKVLFISNLFPGEGEGYLGFDNARVLHQLREEGGFDVRVIALRPAFWPEAWLRRNRSREEEEPFSTRMLKVPYLPRLKIGGRINPVLIEVVLRRAVERWVTGWRPDVILGSWLFPDCCAIERVFRGTDIPVVAIAQGTDVHGYLNDERRKEAILEMGRGVSGLIARSENLKHRLVEAGVAAGKIEVIYNGVDRDLFRPREMYAARDEVGLLPAEKVVLFVGNLREVKRPLDLVEAHARLDDDIRLCFVGSGGLEKEIKNRAIELGTWKQVQLLGGLEPAKVATYMNAADVLCISSANEGLPNVLLEAMACGLPVVSTDVGGISEVLEPGRNGELVAPGSIEGLEKGIRSVFAGSCAREDVAATGAVFDWKRSGEAYEKMLGAVVVKGEEGGR